MIPDPWFRAANYNNPIGMFFPRPEDQRELDEGERRLGRFILPPFQRPAVWTRAQQVLLIESIWNTLPIGACVVNYIHAWPLRAPDGWLLDGQQRWTAILSYVAGDFEVYGCRYPDLPHVYRRRFEDRPVPMLHTQIDDIDQCKDVYRRLAYGGTPHEPEGATQ